MKGNEVMKMKRTMSVVMVLLMIIFSSMNAVVFADSENPAAGTEYFESFEGYAEGADGGWTSKNNGTSKVVSLDGNRCLLIEPQSSASGACIDFADSDKLGNAAKDSNFTVDFDFKFNEKNITTSVGGANKTPENHFSLSGNGSLKEAYAFLQAPASVDASRAYNSNVAWTGTISLPDTYKTAVSPSTTTGNTLYMHRWNHARMVCRTVEYADGEETKTADYAQIYINGKLLATLPQRYSATTLTQLAVSIDPKTVEGTGIYIDNVKAAVGEKGTREDISCDYEKYVLGPIGFDSSTTPDTSSANQYIGNAQIDSERITVKKGLTAVILDGINGKKAADKYVAKPASGDYLTSASIGTLNDGESFELSFDYLPTTSEMYFQQRVQIGTNAASFPRLMSLSDKCVKLNFSSDYKTYDTYYYNISSSGLNTNEWYRITYVLTGGNGTGTYNTASVYVNGIPVAQNVELTRYAAAIAGNTGEYMQWQKSGRTDIYGTGNFDNVQIKEYRGGAVFSAPVIADAVSQGYGAQYVPGDMTVADAKTYFALGKNLRYEITGENGSLASDTESAEGKYILAVSNDGRYAYAKLIANEAPVVNNTDSSSISGTNLAVTAKPGFDYGKGADNEAVSLKSENGTDVGKYSKSAGASKAQTAEFYMFAEDNSFNLKIAGRPTYDGSTFNGGWVLLDLSGGNVKIADNAGTDRLASPIHKNAAKYKIGEWTKIGLTVYPGSDKYTVRVNDEEFEGSFAKRIKANGYFEVQIGTSANVIIDDYKVLNGRMSHNKGEKAVLDTSALSCGILLDENKISAGKVIPDCFGANIPTAEKVFVNAEGTRISSPADGAKVIFVNGGLFTSYDIISRKNALTQVDTDTEGKLKFVVDKTTDKNLHAINAVFCGSELVRIQDMLPINFGSENSVYIYTDKPEDAQNNFKLLLWEISSATPFAKPIEYYVNK